MQSTRCGLETGEVLDEMPAWGRGDAPRRTRELGHLRELMSGAISSQLVAVQSEDPLGQALNTILVKSWFQRLHSPSGAVPGCTGARASQRMLVPAASLTHTAARSCSCGVSVLLARAPSGWLLPIPNSVISVFFPSCIYRQ